MPVGNLCEWSAGVFAITTSDWFTACRHGRADSRTPFRVNPATCPAPLRLAHLVARRLCQFTGIIQSLNGN